MCRESVRLFIFGTLKQDFPNYRFNHGKRLAGLFTTVERYPLYLVGDRFSPWLINAPGKGEKVTGEVFILNDKYLETMDRLERVDKKDGYSRLKLQICEQTTRDKHTVYCYLKPEHLLNPAKIRLGPLTRYQHEHAGLYRSRSNHER